MLFISSSIPSSCQIHVQTLPFTVGVLSKLYHSFPFAIWFNRSVMSIIPLLTRVLTEVVLHCSSFLMECFQLRSSPLYSFLKWVYLSRFMVHSFVKEAT